MLLIIAPSDLTILKSYTNFIDIHDIVDFYVKK